MFVYEICKSASRTRILFCVLVSDYICASLTWQEVMFETNIFQIYLHTHFGKQNKTKPCYMEMLPHLNEYLLYKLNFPSDILGHRYAWALFSSPEWMCFWSAFLSQISHHRHSCLKLLGQWTHNYLSVQSRLWIVNLIWHVSSSRAFSMEAVVVLFSKCTTEEPESATLFLRNHYKIEVKNIPFIPTCRNGSFSSSWYTIIALMELIWFLRHNLSWVCICPSNIFFKMFKRQPGMLSPVKKIAIK